VKKIFLSLLTFAMVSSAILTGCGKKATTDQSLEQIKKKGFFVVGLDDEFPPMGFRGKKADEIVGFDIDLAKAVANKLGVKVKFNPVSWDGIIFSLNKGDIDVIWNGLTITPERKEKIAFTSAYLNNRQIIMVYKGSKIKTKADLKGKTVGLQLGSSSEKALNTATSIAKTLKEVKKYENNTLALMDLAAKRTDAVVVDEIVGRWIMSKRPGVYTVLKDDFGREEYGVGMRKNDASFTRALNAALTDVKNSKTGVNISKKWFSADILKK